MLNMNIYFIWFFIMFMMSLFIAYFSILFGCYDYFVMIEFYIMNINSVSIYYTMIFDWISLVFMFVVMFISSMVVLYSYDYLGIKSYSCIRFLFIVILFVISMLLMVVSPNLISILLGWDGLGLVSYCLVIYYSSMKSYLAGMITCLTNRLGDIGLLISIAWLSSYGSWHFMFYNNIYYLLIFYMIIFCSFTKSAQIPFSSWLPAAMAAPTPVSALVHSSTLVTAGVYLLIRFYNLIEFNFFFTFLSLMTLLFSSFCANYEFDLKKIIAYSTLSQLGLMMCSLLLGMKELSFFHLITHAMFKSLLFLCAGIFIYYMNDNQDIRFMNSLSVNMPLTCTCFNVSSMALCGIPFMSGFYSKDLIIELVVFNGVSFFFFFFFFFSIGLTVSYTLRLFYYSMIKVGFLNCYLSFFDSYSLMSISIYILSLISVIFGSLLMWMMNFDLFFFVLPFYVKLMTLLSLSLGIWFGFEVFGFNNFMNVNYYFFNGNMWFMFSYSFFIYFYLYKLMLSYGNIINSWGEYYGGFGMTYYFMKLTDFIYLNMNNNMKIFILFFFIWFLFSI
uniref:NADH-ubiquinone oxidoreductase chain 5 n=1 Tax=Signoretia aureola TaxID=2901393 RepID=A0A8K2ATZ1_9HEMI|nr:NADH dehydrogenase subunit 5 [Signoretia aureola]